MVRKNKNGISSIIATLLLIVLTIVLIAVVWGVVNNLVSKEIASSSACFGNFEKVTINDLYSCFNDSGDNIRISLNVEDIEVEGILVSVSSPEQSKTFTLTEEAQAIAGLKYYNGTTLVKVPNKNSGITYLYSWTGSDIPNSVQISPIIGGQQCSMSDSITTIDSCTLFG